MIKLVLFDLDGVLCSAVRLHYKAFASALYCVTGSHITLEEHNERFNGLPSKNKLNILASERRISPLDIEQVNRIKQEFTVALIKEYIRLDPTKIEIMENLEIQGIHIGCVTNCSRRTAELMLRNVGVLDYLELLLTNEQIVNPKPDPDGYLQAMGAQKFQPLCEKDVLIIEDSPVGIQAASLTGANVWSVVNPDEVTWANLSKLL